MSSTEICKKNPIPAVRAIIKNDNNDILFLQRSNNGIGGGSWCLPGGKIDYGSKAIDSLRKEVYEETALECKEIIFQFYFDGLPKQEGEGHFPTFYFFCEAIGELILNDESINYKWINYKALDKYNIVFDNDLAVKKYFGL